MTAVDWNDANVAILTRGVDAGDPYSAIAKRIGWPCTRNSAIGKASRLGITRPRLDGPNRGRSRPKTRVTANNAGAFGLGTIIRNLAARLPDKPLPAPKAPLAAVNPKPWVERAFGECCYPVSGEGADTLSCCNPAPKTAAWNYCPTHLAVMTTKGPTEAQRQALIRAREAKAKSLRRAA